MRYSGAKRYNVCIQVANNSGKKQCAYRVNIPVNIAKCCQLVNPGKRHVVLETTISLRNLRIKGFEKLSMFPIIWKVKV